MRDCAPLAVGQNIVGDFPSFSEGLSLRVTGNDEVGITPQDFPSFSEGLSLRDSGDGLIAFCRSHFPSFSEGLSLRVTRPERSTKPRALFPFLFGGTFIEGLSHTGTRPDVKHFPSFSEGLSLRVRPVCRMSVSIEDFPSFSEGLSLRGLC